jgi:hypothetical protein
VWVGVVRGPARAWVRAPAEEAKLVDMEKEDAIMVVR